MAQEDDSSPEDKTEDATAHRLEEARKKGQVAFSKEVIHWCVLACASMCLCVFYPLTLPAFTSTLSQILSNSHQITLDTNSLSEVLKNVLSQAFSKILLPLLSIPVLVLFVGFIQTKLLVSMESIKPKFDKISPIAGFKRLFSKKALMEFFKSFIKVLLIAWVLYLIVLEQLPSLTESSFYEIVSSLALLKKDVQTILVTLLCVLGVIALLDYASQKFSFLKKMRMSKQEVKEEYKKLEGDPAIKQRIRQIAQERLKNRMMTAVPDATVVIMNPTHYAVALKYDMDTMDAPVVVAKGLDFVALKIKEVAKEHKIPIVENPPLARALFSSTEIEQEIPPEHYKAVADVIRFVMKLKKQQF